MARIEALLSARLFLVPQLVGDRLFFLSNISGHLSLYAMDRAGSVPEPLLPPDIALQNPDLIGGYSFYVFPKIGKILVMIDHDGDENYQPMFIPIDGGFPEPVFGPALAQDRVALTHADEDANFVYLVSQSRREPVIRAYRGHVETRALENLGEGPYLGGFAGISEDHSKIVIADAYTEGDLVLYLWTKAQPQRQLLYGIPLESRAEGQDVPLNGIRVLHFVGNDQAVLCTTALFEDTYGLAYFKLNQAQDIKPVKISGTVHTGVGELVDLRSLHHDNRFAVIYNIDGASWVYEGTFDEAALEFRLDKVIVGQGQLANGVLESLYYDKVQDVYALSFSTATSPTQLYTVAGKDRHQIGVHTRERLLGIAADQLSAGEDASFTTHDGLRVSARLYLPAPSLGFSGPRPIVYYIHGGPQGQERPNFAWFSMPLIQYLTLNGFAVFVPNVRGSTGYGLDYTKRVDRDWGGQDRLDHVYAMSVLAKDARLDTHRTGVVGRSYGGYMTLTLATRHPDLWAASVDMFGPYDLFTFMERIPETWKPYFAIAVGDPIKDHDLLMERSPKTYIDHVAAPMLVIQGKNDPRVVERESRDVVEYLRAKGKQIDYLMFENEGHDVLKYENRVTCYSRITEFFRQYLKP